MAYRFRSRDGLMQTNDAKGLRLWEDIADRHRQEQSLASALLLEMGVKLEHPDDGWVNRELNMVNPCYSRFNLGPCVGDLIALGWPWSGYRIVRVARIEVVRILTDMTRYYFEETGQNLGPVSLGK